MTIAAWSAPPLVPGNEYYFTFVHRNPTAVMLNFIATLGISPPRPDAGDGDDDAAGEVVEDVPVEAIEDVVPDAVEEADAAPPDVEEDIVDGSGDVDGTITVGDGGCGCRTIPTSGASFLSALLLGAAFLLLRRK